MDMKKDRAVSKEEGKSLADEFGAGFLEVTVHIQYLYPLLLPFDIYFIDFLFIKLLQAKENFKIKDAFELLVRKIISKNPSAGSGDGSSATGVFGGGKAEKYKKILLYLFKTFNINEYDNRFADDEDSNSSPSNTKKKSGSSKNNKKASSPSAATPTSSGEAEKKGKCHIL